MTRALPGLPAWHPAWPGFSVRGSLPLPVPLPAEALGVLEPGLVLDGLAFERKTEFHVTLLNRELGARVHAACAAGDELAATLPALFAALDWRWRGTGERWLLREATPDGVAHSIIELIDMPAFARFRGTVGEALGVALPDAPAHITLYVAGDPAGIGLDSQAEFERLRLRAR